MNNKFIHINDYSNLLNYKVHFEFNVKQNELQEIYIHKLWTKIKKTLKYFSIPRLT